MPPRRGTGALQLVRRYLWLNDLFSDICWYLRSRKNRLCEEAILKPVEICNITGLISQVVPPVRH